MEPIQTPSNDALHMQIEALKGRISSCEFNMDLYRDMTKIEHTRTLELILQLGERVNRLMTGVILLSVAVIFLSLRIIL